MFHVSNKLASLSVLIVCCQLVACNRRPTTMNPNAPILKIAVMANGHITVDGSAATIESVQASLKRLAEQKGMVWYYREAGQGEAPPQSADVIRAVIQNRLPVRLSSRPDYSDTVGLDGRPIANASAGK